MTSSVYHSPGAQKPLTLSDLPATDRCAYYRRVISPAGLSHSRPVEGMKAPAHTSTYRSTSIPGDVSHAAQHSINKPTYGSLPANAHVPARSVLSERDANRPPLPSSYTRSVSPYDSPESLPSRPVSSQLCHDLHATSTSSKTRWPASSLFAQVPAPALEAVAGAPSAALSVHRRYDEVVRTLGSDPSALIDPACARRMVAATVLDAVMCAAPLLESLAGCAMVKGDEDCPALIMAVLAAVVADRSSDTSHTSELCVRGEAASLSVTFVRNVLAFVEAAVSASTAVGEGKSLQMSGGRRVLGASSEATEGGGLRGVSVADFGTVHECERLITIRLEGGTFPPFETLSLMATHGAERTHPAARAEGGLVGGSAAASVIASLPTVYARAHCHDVAVRVAADVDVHSAAPSPSTNSTVFWRTPAVDVCSPPPFLRSTTSAHSHTNDSVSATPLDAVAAAILQCALGCSLCSRMAGDPLRALQLLGAPPHDFSISVSAVAAVIATMDVLLRARVDVVTAFSSAVSGGGRAWADSGALAKAPSSVVSSHHTLPQSRGGTATGLGMRYKDGGGTVAMGVGESRVRQMSETRHPRPSVGSTGAPPAVPALSSMTQPPVAPPRGGVPAAAHGDPHRSGSGVDTITPTSAGLGGGGVSPPAMGAVDELGAVGEDQEANLVGVDNPAPRQRAWEESQGPPSYDTTAGTHTRGGSGRGSVPHVRSQAPPYNESSYAGRGGKAAASTSVGSLQRVGAKGTGRGTSSAAAATIFTLAPSDHTTGGGGRFVPPPTFSAAHALLSSAGRLLPGGGRKMPPSHRDLPGHPPMGAVAASRSRAVRGGSAVPGATSAPGVPSSTASRSGSRVPPQKGQSEKTSTDGQDGRTGGTSPRPVRGRAPPTYMYGPRRTSPQATQQQPPPPTYTSPPVSRPGVVASSARAFTGPRSAVPRRGHFHKSPRGSTRPLSAAHPPNDPPFLPSSPGPLAAAVAASVHKLAVSASKPREGSLPVDRIGPRVDSAGAVVQREGQPSSATHVAQLRAAQYRSATSTPPRSVSAAAALGGPFSPSLEDATLLDFAPPAPLAPDRAPRGPSPHRTHSPPSRHVIDADHDQMPARSHILNHVVRRDPAAPPLGTLGVVLDRRPASVGGVPADAGGPVSITKDLVRPSTDAASRVAGVPPVYDSSAIRGANDGEVHHARSRTLSVGRVGTTRPAVGSVLQAEESNAFSVAGGTDRGFKVQRSSSAAMPRADADPDAYFPKHMWRTMQEDEALIANMSDVESDD